MSVSNGKIIKELIDLGADVSGYRVNGSDKSEIKKNITRIIANARTHGKKEHIEDRTQLELTIDLVSQHKT
jgi:thiamine monophosphate synthase